MTDSNSTDNTGQDGDLATQQSKPRLAQPPMYKVVLINDDYTPMDFVVDVLRYFFNMSVEKATQVMLKVHGELFRSISQEQRYLYLFKYLKESYKSSQY